jgi:hypothetical protein
VSAFGRNLEKYFTNRLMLSVIFKTYKEQLDTADVAKMGDNPAGPICSLANNDYAIGTSYVLREFVKLLFDKLFADEKWGKTVPILQYYAKILKEYRPEEKIPEAINAIDQILNCPDKAIKDEAYAILVKFANAIVADMITSGDTSQFENYKNVTRRLKAANKPMSLDISSFDNIPKRERSSEIFYVIEQFNRKEISNVKPPGGRQLDNIQNGLEYLKDDRKETALKDLLTLYWNADDMRTPVSMEKYVRYLHENKKLHLYVHYLGEDEGLSTIRQIYADELKRAFHEGEFKDSNDIVDALHNWWRILREECRFGQTDPIMDEYRKYFPKLGSIEALCRTLLPPSGRKLMEIFKDIPHEQYTQGVEMITRFDAEAEARGEFFRIFKKMDEHFKQFDLRMDYWIIKTNRDLPAEWVLSRAVIQAVRDRAFGQHVIEAYMNKRNERQGNRKNLSALYDVLKLLGDGSRYGREISYNIFEHTRSLLGRLLFKFVQDNALQEVIDSADEYKALYQLDPQSNGFVTDAGKYIRSEIVRYSKGKQEVPLETLKKFAAVDMGYLFGGTMNQSNAGSGNNPSNLEGYLLIGSAILFIISAVSCFALMTDGSIGGIADTLATTLPGGFMHIVLAVAAFLTLAASLMYLLKSVFDN